MSGDEIDIDPARARGAFTYGLTQLRVVDDGLEPGHQFELIDVMAALAEAVKVVTVDAVTPAEMLLRRLAKATLDLLSTAFMRTPEDGEIVAVWRQAYEEWLAC